MRTSIRTGKIFTEEILNAHPRRALEVLRMPITTFLDLRDWLSQNSTLRASRYVSMEEQLMSFLWIIGHNASNREAQEQFQHSGETISRHFRTCEVFPGRYHSGEGSISHHYNYAQPLAQ
jgi:hypothetical protein